MDKELSHIEVMTVDQIINLQRGSYDDFKNSESMDVSVLVHLKFLFISRNR
jgi:hypothetical protein